MFSKIKDLVVSISNIITTIFTYILLGSTLGMALILTFGGYLILYGIIIAVPVSVVIFIVYEMFHLLGVF